MKYNNSNKWNELKHDYDYNNSNPHPHGKADYFTDEELIEKYKIDGKSMKDIIQDIEILLM